MHGLIGKLKAIPGQRDVLAQILLNGAADMPGCLSYVVATDPTDGDAIWITEVWESRELHEASLTLQTVQQAIAQGRPLIAGFGERFETTPIGGHGLQHSSRPVSRPEEM
jgi:quinol monooxygenase YgiN